ncbi:hypothetical protein DICSQDRAFT_169939 [Dichomitus squalens LYAD-421 SS1]|uniref:Glucose-methanol-choline oxidoreductase C-terminal domain-containing protein n=1 Tax=Dichomitus squalens (strain LYAD-421) TaxID=732165 RepID=R7T0J7_DICSQ|nr:uncharacterized protein DICSQDRAFT_169939 [Dichomitus squalens LYAD-421 SS1]EJF61515.1 hypothetical protein DICSQDRAFT_169939 [Dichomitus squalens LYAD-421 SS1]
MDNPDILEQHGINVKVDLPGVEENLREPDPEYSLQGLFATIPAQASVFLSADALGPQRTSLGGVHRRTRNLFDDKKQPQAEYVSQVSPTSLSLHLTLLPLHVGYSCSSAANKWRLPLRPSRARATSPSCARSPALSRTARASADPLAPSRIDPNYFGSEADHDLYVHVLQHTVKGLVEYIKKNGFQVFHPVGTAAMIARADGGVVDPTLKVFGTRNLRVVDLSVLPMEFVCHAVGSVRYLRAAADILKSELPGKPGN